MIPGRSHRGSAGVLAVALVLVAALGAAAVAELTAAAVGRARVDATADVVVLATVAGGADEGRRVAAANDAQVLGLQVDPDGRATVEITSGAHLGRASAAPLGDVLEDPGPDRPPR